jgi:hypothetical protein
LENKRVVDQQAGTRHRRRTLDPDARYDRAVKILERAEIMDNEARQRALFDALVSEVEEIVAIRPDDAEFNHLAGLCWYDHPEASDRRSRLTRSYLERAVQLNPSHQFARVFLAYHHGDEGRYQESLDCLAALDYDYFTQMGQSWRNLKTDELKLACRLYLSSQDTPRDDMRQLADQIDRLAERYADAAPEDAAAPTEIVRCVVAVINQRARSESLVRIATAMVRLIDNLEYVLPMRLEYNALRQYVENAS